MSLIFTKNNQESAKELFEKRRYYNFYTTFSKYDNLTDFNLAEKYMYGRVDRDYLPIILNENTVKLRQNTLVSSPQKTLFSPAFVADAFDAMALQFDKARLTGKIKDDDKYLSSLTIYNSYNAPKRLYMNYYKQMSKSLKNEFDRTRIIIKNFDDFTDEILKMLKKTTHGFPFTFTGFVKSRFCTPMASGLAIEIADLQFSNDEKKMALFLNSKNWKYYLNTCRSYGFLVDRNRPWRIVANIGSDEMLRYSRKYNLESTNEILFSGYQKVHLEYYAAFKNLMLGLYNTIKKTQYPTNEYCQATGKNIISMIHPQQYTMERLEEDYSEKYFMELYYKIRFMEESENLSYSDYQRRRLIRSAVYRADIIPHARAMTDFEKKINEPYNSSGSLTRLNHSAIMRLQHERANIDEDEIAKVFSSY
jgi:hypothetical protein